MKNRPRRSPLRGRSPRSERSHRTPSRRDPDRGISRRDLLLWLGALGAGGMGGGLVACSDRPAEEILDTSSEPAVVQEGGVVSGAVSGLFSGAAVAGASIQVVGVGTATADISGRFSLRVPRSGDFEVRIRAPGFLERRSAIRIASNAEVSVSLIEEDRDFDLSFFDQFGRGRGPVFDVSPRTPGRTSRWLQPPRIVLYRRIVDSTRAGGRLSDRRIEGIERVVGTNFVPFTGGSLGPAPGVHVVDAPPPTDLRRVPEGSLAIWQTDDGGRGAETLGGIGDRWSIARAWAFCDVDSDLGVVNHVFAHALGAQEVATSTPSVMNPDGRFRLSDEDVAAATVLYNRPPGSRSPDVDPDGAFLNA